MAISSSLRRLLRIRQLEEELSRTDLAAAMSALHGVERAQTAMGERELRGYRTVGQSAANGDLLDRVAGVEESGIADRHLESLEEMRRKALAEAEEKLAAYGGKRQERMQAETLLSEQQALARVESERREQQAVDDWGAMRKGAQARRKDSSH